MIAGLLLIALPISFGNFGRGNSDTRMLKVGNLWTVLRDSVNKFEK
jgi:hypothetical protein